MSVTLALAAIESELVAMKALNSIGSITRDEIKSRAEVVASKYWLEVRAAEENRTYAHDYHSQYRSTSTSLQKELFKSIAKLEDELCTFIFVPF